MSNRKIELLTALTDLQDMRQSAGLSYRKLAEMSGVSVLTAYNALTGRHDPKWSTLVRLSKTLQDEKAGQAQI